MIGEPIDKHCVILLNRTDILRLLIGQQNLVDKFLLL
jgi:hypothetical protein